jgi:hypothetical protein
MKTLYESILDRTKDKVGSVKKRINALGMRFPLWTFVVRGYAGGTGIFTKLEKSERYNEIVDGLSMISTPEIVCDNYWEKDAKRFITFIDNIDVKGCSKPEDLSRVITRELDDCLGHNVARCECQLDVNKSPVFHIWKGSTAIMVFRIKMN